MQDRVRDALQRGAIDEALATARGWVDTAPTSVDALRGLGMVLAEAGLGEEALASIDRAIELAPDDAGLHLQRGALLARVRKLDDAQAALAHSLGLDPNLFPAYVVKAQLALARGDVDEAERLGTVATRIAPGDPQLISIDAAIALRRGDVDRALKLATSNMEALGSDPQLLSILGAAYLAKRHWAFAEQAFRRLLEARPDQHAVRAVIARLAQLQGRPAEAADLLGPLLQADAGDADELRLVAVSYELQAGRTAQALLHLRLLLARHPGDRRVLQTLLAVWRLEGGQEAQATLEAALATHATVSDLWATRLLLEVPGSSAALDVVRRWNTAMPEHGPALEAGLMCAGHAGDASESERFARALVALDPRHVVAEQVIVESMMAAEPDAAMERADALIAGTLADGVHDLRSWKGWLLDRHARTADAVRIWAAQHREPLGQRMALPTITRADMAGSAPAEAMSGPTRTLLLWGAPGSGIERLADVMGRLGAPVLVDRFGPSSPADPLQWKETAQRLVDGMLRGDEVLAQWRDGLRARGASSDHVIDWLPWWDNALVPVLREGLPTGRLLTAIRDPRDMLLDWLAFGSPLPLAPGEPPAAAHWLSQALTQLVDLEQCGAYPVTILRVDESLLHPQLLINQLAEVLGAGVPDVPALPPQRRLPPGRWRAYGAELGDAFAVLTPVAVRLGYSDT
ncbi:tetratricopeptide repeat protein [Xanthomonas sp. XNM01]|uniref:tetratricopeptide repeat protein n=1 Tax=Xanthomonas sp. XNM01 TaxID=2769289 RepID=UPI001786D1C1|nr:tetratricopeptide repeat protein [Xanthomonas sp. XNM01]MBD9370491.1 tetratricopeptide repeat protein [Xanthomonas sp. XNM01]